MDHINVTKDLQIAKFSQLVDLTLLKPSQAFETRLLETGFSQSLHTLWLVLFSPRDC